jgi:tRNA(adenine34) deaminase
MREALAEAEAAAAAGDVPVGAVVLDADGNVIARGRNRREAAGDPTAHAELDAIRAAARVVGGWRLDAHTLVVTLEPCTMCAGAVTAARLDRLVFGAADPRAGAVGSLWDVVRDQRLVPVPEVIGGVLAGECVNVILDFFAERRLAASRCCCQSQVSSAAVESPSGRGRTPRKRVRGQPLRGFKSHLHRSWALPVRCCGSFPEPLADIARGDDPPEPPSVGCADEWAARLRRLVGRCPRTRALSRNHCG